MDDDIEEIIKAAKHMRFREGRKPFPLHSVSRLPESKRRMKRAIKERIRFLYGAYISLAVFVSDEDAELFLDDGSGGKKIRIIKRVLREIEKNRGEIAAFDPFIEDA